MCNPILDIERLTTQLAELKRQLCEEAEGDRERRLYLTSKRKLRQASLVHDTIDALDRLTLPQTEVEVAATPTVQAEARRCAALMQKVFLPPLGNAAARAILESAGLEPDTPVAETRGEPDSVRIIEGIEPIDPEPIKRE